MRARRVAVVAVLAVALVIAAVAFVSTGLRLAMNPAEPSAPRRPPPALRVFDRAQSPEEESDAVVLPGLDDRASASVRRLGNPDGLVVLGWRTSGDVCEGDYRPGPSVLPAIECAKARDFADGGVSIRWPDSPDLGPFDITWMPDGALRLTSARPPEGIAVSPER